MGFWRKYKKIFFLIIFLALVALIGFIIYNTFFKPATAPEEVIPGEKEVVTTTPGGLLPEAEEGEGVIITEEGEERVITGITEGQDKQRIEIDDKARGGVTRTTELVESPTLNPSLHDNGSDLRYYDRKDGHFYRVDKDGNKVLLSEKEFYGVDKVNWSPAESKAIIEYPDGSNIVYDFEQEKQVTLPKHWEDFRFSDKGDKIVMKSIGIDPENRWLAISNPDGSRSQAIEKIGENADKVYPSWSPNDQTIAMHTRGVDFNRQEVFFVGKNKENFKSTIIEGRGFQPKWSTEGDKLLYSVYSTEDELKPKLWIVNAQGESIGTGRGSLGVETWAEKCTFGNNDQVYCAVPEELPEGAGMFPELADNTQDKLYKIDLRTGMKKLIAIPDKAFNISQMMISEDESNLYFTDKTTERLHKIELN